MIWTFHYSFSSRCHKFDNATRPLLCQNICEQNTAKQYDSNKASIITWLNSYLRWRLKDGYIQAKKQKKYSASVRVDKNNKIIDPVDNLPAKPDTVAILQEIEEWVIDDPEHKLRSTNLAQHPQITCQLLIQKRLPPETPWKNLAQEYGISAGTLSSFYQRKCKPLLREFSRSQEYI